MTSVECPVTPSRHFLRQGFTNIRLGTPGLKSGLLPKLQQNALCGSVPIVCDVLLDQLIGALFDEDRRSEERRVGKGCGARWVRGLYEKRSDRAESWYDG